MAEANDTPPAPPAASGPRSGAGFELRLERGGAYVRLTGQPIADGIRLESLTLQVPDVKFPFDVGRGAGQFRHRLADLVELSVAVDPSAAGAALAAAGVAAFGLEDVELAPRDGFLEIAGRLSGGPRFTLEAGLLPAGDQGVALVFHSPRLLGPGPIPAAALPHIARAVVDAVGSEALPPQPLAALLRRVLAPRGWKLPRGAGARIACATVSDGAARLRWDRAAGGPALVSTDPGLLAAEEGARTFREAEALLARGDHAGARDAYLAAGPAASAHPFAAERLLSLLALDERYHEEALDLAGEWLARRPEFPAALAAEAKVRVARGEDARAARAWASLAAGAAERGRSFLALAAADAACALEGAAPEDALRGAEVALRVRRDHVPALRVLRALARASGDREALLRANRRLVSHDPDPASKARAHAELGELLLEADPPGARLHLDHALRLAPEDADALAALARACTAAGEPLRAIRALERLKDVALARGDRAGAARAAADAGALWEGPLAHGENALLRFREAADLAPSAEAHARAAAAAEKAGQWAEAAEHHAAVLAALAPGDPGAPALAARTRVALADVAEKRLGDAAGAAAHLEKAAALAPDDGALLRRLATLQRSLGRTAEATAALDRLAALEPDAGARATLLAEAGEGAATLGLAADARGRFTAALACDPTCRPALLGLAGLARERGDAVAERAALERLLPYLAAGPESAQVHDRLADACARAGDLGAAMRAAAAARAADPCAARLDACLRLARRAEDGPALAALLADRARDAAAGGDPSTATHAWLERARLLAAGAPAEALAALAEARALSPGDEAVLRAQAELAERTGDARLALGCLAALLEAAPDDAGAIEVRAARAAILAGETAAAKDHAERALAHGAPGAAEVLDEILERAGDDAARADVLARLGRHLEAARLFERHGDAARAREALERAAREPGQAPQALARLAEARLAEGDRPGAAEALLALARLGDAREGARVALRAHAIGRDPGALDAALALDARFAPALARRAALRAGSDPRAALADAEAALAGEGLEADERPGLLALAARAAAAAGDGAAARRHLDAYCEAAPEDDGALARLAALHRAAGARAELARVLARRLPLASAAEAAPVRLELSDLLAETDPARAALLAREALEHDPASAAALRALTTAPRSAHVSAGERVGLLERLAALDCASPEEAAAALSARARLMADAGDRAGALAAAREASRLAPAPDDLLELHARLARDAGDPAEAAQLLLARARRAREGGDPSAPERLAEAGLEALSAGIRGGEEPLREALALGPSRETARAALEALVRAARERGDATAEQEDLARLVPLLPTGARPAALLRHAALALEGGSPALARASAEEARALAPRDPAAVEGCRTVALAQGDLASVAELLREGALLEPARAGPLLLERARLLAALGRPEDADAAFAAALAALPPERALADEHSRLRRETLPDRSAAAPLETYAGRATGRDAAVALRVAAAVALAGGDLGAALRCARAAHARVPEDAAFAGPLLARVLYLRGARAEALDLHRRLLEAGFPGLGADESVALCRQAADLAEDAGDRAFALRALDELLARRPQDMDAALLRFELDPERGRAARALAGAAAACRSLRRRALALCSAARGALCEANDPALADDLFARAQDAAAHAPALAADVAVRRAQALRGAEGASSPAYLAALHEAAAAAQAAGDRAGARDLLEEAVARQRERGLFAEAASDLLQLDALAAAEGDFAESGARLRAAAALQREAGRLDAAAETLRRACEANPASRETVRQLEDVLREQGGDGAGAIAALLAGSAARLPAGPERAAVLVELSDAHAARGASDEAERALRAALADVPGQPEAEDRLLALLEGAARSGERGRLLLERSARLPECGERRALRRAAAQALGSSSDPGDRDLAVETWRALAAADPFDLEAPRAAAALLTGLGRRAEAVPCLATLLRADPADADAARELAAAFDACPADDAAFAAALHAAASDPERTGAVLAARAAAVPEGAASCHRERGDLLHATGRAEEAIAAYEAALAAAPDDPDVLVALAGCVADARGDEAAAELDRHVVARAEIDPSGHGACEAPSRYRLGLALAGAGRSDEATAHLERALALAPGDAYATLALAALAQAHAERGDHDAALAAARARVERAEALGVEDERAWALEAEAALRERIARAREGEPPAGSDPAAAPADQAEPADPPLDAAPAADADHLAIAHAAAVRASDAEDPATRSVAWIETAEALARAGAPSDEVRSAVELACDADPDSVAPWRARARLETALGDPHAAARAQLAVSIRAEGAEAARAALEAARLFDDAGQYEEAARAYRAAAHASPTAVPAETLRAAEALAVGDAATAAGLLAAVDPVQLPDEARSAHARKLARALDAAGRADEAERAWTELLSTAPADAEAFARASELAFARAGIEAWIEAAAAHEHALATWGEVARQRDLRHERGRLLAEAGRIEAARGAFHAALELDPGHLPTLDALAALETRRDDWAAAAAGLAGEAEQAADPAEAAALCLRVAQILRERLSDDAGAIAALRTALARARSSPSPAAQRSAAEAEALLGDLGAPSGEDGGTAVGAPADVVAAVLAAHAAAAEGPERAEILERLASRLERSGDPEGAERALQSARAADPDRLDHPAPAPQPPDPLPPTQSNSEPAAAASLPTENSALPEDTYPSPSQSDSTAPLPTQSNLPERPLPTQSNLPAPEPGSEAPGSPAAPPTEGTLGEAPSRDPESVAREGRGLMERGDFPAAHERLSLALSLDPSDLTVARDLCRVSEKLGRFDDYVRLGELCADAIAAYDPLAAAARFRHFADVLRERFGDLQGAGVMLEKALALVPDDPDAHRQLLEIWTDHPASAPRALAAWLDLARKDPADGEALAAVAALCERLKISSNPAETVRVAERGRLAASLAAFASPSRPLPPPGAMPAALTPELRARVAAPGATGPLARLLQLLAPWLEPLFPADLRRHLIRPEDRLDATRAPALHANLTGASRALGSRAFAAFVSARPGVEVAIENTQPPALVFSTDAAALGERELAFLSARTLELLDRGWALVGRFAPNDLAILLELACRFAGGAPRSMGLPAQRAGAFLAVLETQVPASARATARELAAAAAEELDGTDPRAFAASLRRTANRTALLYGGDPGAALAAVALLDRRLAGGSTDPAAALALPDLRDLALFALSDPFLQLRTAVLG